MDNNCANCMNDWRKGNLCKECKDVLGFRGGSFDLQEKVIKIYDLYKNTNSKGEKSSCIDKLNAFGYDVVYGDILINIPKKLNTNST